MILKHSNPKKDVILPRSFLNQSKMQLNLPSDYTCVLTLNASRINIIYEEKIISIISIKYRAEV